MAETELKGRVKLKADPIDVGEAGAKLKDSLGSLVRDIPGLSEIFNIGSKSAELLGRHVGTLREHFQHVRKGMADVFGGKRNKIDTGGLPDAISQAAAGSESGTPSGAAEGLSGLVEGLGMPALTAVGLSALGVVAMVEFTRATMMAAKKLVTFNEHLGGGIGPMGIVESIQKMQNTFLELRAGGSLAASTLALNNAFFKLKSDLEIAMLPALKSFTEMMTGLVKALTPFMVLFTKGIVKDVNEITHPATILKGLMGNPIAEGAKILGIKPVEFPLPKIKPTLPHPPGAPSLVNAHAPPLAHLPGVPAAVDAHNKSLLHATAVANHGFQQQVKVLAHHAQETAKNTAKLAANTEHIKNVIDIHSEAFKKAHAMSMGFYEFMTRELAPLRGHEKPSTPQQRWQKKLEAQAAERTKQGIHQTGRPAAWEHHHGK